MIERVIIDVPQARLVRLQMAPDPHRSTICDHIVCGGEWADVQWSPDGTQLAFVSSSRDHRSATLRVADAETGAVRTVLNETVPTFFESGYRTVNWRVLFAAARCSGTRSRTTGDTCTFTIWRRARSSGA